MKATAPEHWLFGIDFDNSFEKYKWSISFSLSVQRVWHKKINQNR